MQFIELNTTIDNYVKESVQSALECGLTLDHREAEVKVREQLVAVKSALFNTFYIIGDVRCPKRCDSMDHKSFMAKMNEWWKLPPFNTFCDLLSLNDQIGPSTDELTTHDMLCSSNVSLKELKLLVRLYREDILNKSHVQEYNQFVVRMPEIFRRDKLGLINHISQVEHGKPLKQIKRNPDYVQDFFYNICYKRPPPRKSMNTPSYFTLMYNIILWSKDGISFKDLFYAMVYISSHVYKYVLFTRVFPLSRNTYSLLRNYFVGNERKIFEESDKGLWKINTDLKSNPHFFKENSKKKPNRYMVVSQPFIFTKDTYMKERKNCNNAQQQRCDKGKIIDNHESLSRQVSFESETNMDSEKTDLNSLDDLMALPTEKLEILFNSLESVCSDEQNNSSIYSINSVYSMNSSDSGDLIDSSLMNSTDSGDLIDSISSDSADLIDLFGQDSTENDDSLVVSGGNKSQKRKFEETLTLEEVDEIFGHLEGDTNTVLEN